MFAPPGFRDLRTRVCPHRFDGSFDLSGVSKSYCEQYVEPQEQS